MTDFLVKCFVKDHDKTEEPQVRTSYGILASIVGICCNLLLFASKLFIGILVNSVSVMADALTTYRMQLLPLLVLLVCVWRENQQTVIIHLGMDGSSIFRLLLWPFWSFQVGVSLFKTFAW